MEFAKVHGQGDNSKDWELSGLAADCALQRAKDPLERNVHCQQKLFADEVMRGTRVNQNVGVATSKYSSQDDQFVLFLVLCLATSASMGE
jgi:hypothetical protein